MLRRMWLWLIRKGSHSNETSASLHQWLAENPPHLGRCAIHEGDHVRVDTCTRFVSRAARYHGGNGWGR